MLKLNETGLGISAIAKKLKMPVSPGNLRRPVFDPRLGHGPPQPLFCLLVQFRGLVAIDRERPPSKPLSAKEYTANGYPWFVYYDADVKALEGTEALSGLKSVAVMAKEKRSSPRSDNQSITTPNVVNLRAALRASARRLVLTSWVVCRD